MTWNIVPECISTVMLSIIWIYSRKRNSIPDLKSLLFQACFFVTFCAMVTNILSTFLIYHISPATLGLTWIANIFYFIMTPLMGMVYFLYTLSYIYGSHKEMYKTGILFCIPGVLYILMVLINPLNGLLFRISVEDGYSQGPLILVTYIIFYLYCVLCVIVVCTKGKRIPLVTRNILISFPLIAGLVIIAQMIAPNIILSGSAATCALLLIYLYLENKQISMDYLTGVPNRSQFLKTLDIRMGHNKSESRSFRVIVFSLREFKVINDIFGQHNGDMLLVKVAEFLSQKLPGAKAQLYRFGGDEFAIFLEGHNRAMLESVVDTILKRMEKPWHTADCTCMLSAALGIVAYPETTESREELINGIEYAVRVAKGLQRQEKVYYCDSASLDKSKRRQKILSILKESLEKGLFELNFQPIFNVKTGKFPMAEALLRIEHSPLGRISPGEFIPIAEESGLIIDITYWVFERVCWFIRRMDERGIPLKGVSVNFSSLQFAQRDLPNRLQEIIERTQVPVEKIKVEITEGTIAENPEQVTTFIRQIHEMGMRVALDDFGVGFSNLSSVTSLAIDVIKLDRSLILAAMDNEKSALIVGNLTHTFEDVGMTVLAEGVETEEQRDFVANCGCGFIQGFFYARPMTEKDFEIFIRDKNAL